MWRFLTKLKTELSCDPEIPVLSVAKRNETHMLKRDLHSRVYCSIIVHQPTAGEWKEKHRGHSSVTRKNEIFDL
jgi:hypothetical protein